MDHQHAPQPEAHNQDFVLLAEYTPCGKNHTYHSESWPPTGEIMIEKCERQCRFRGCKAWSQTAAALRKHVNKHIQHNSLPLKIVPASSGRTPLKIVVEQDFGAASYDSLDSLANTAAQDTQPLQQDSARPLRPSTPFAASFSEDRLNPRHEVDAQHAPIGTSGPRGSEPIHDFQLFTTSEMMNLQNSSSYDTVRPSIPSVQNQNQEPHAFGAGAGSKREPPISLFTNPWTSSTMLPGTHSASPQPFLQCPDCKMAMRTRTELRKHALWHQKTFRCRQPGCPRTAGFSSPNDLEWHMRSKHPSTLQAVPSTRYQCHVSGCKSKDKSWPRVDNFRSHLKTVHSAIVINEQDFETLITRGKVVGHNGTIPGNGADLRPLHVLADSAASVR